MFFRPFIFLFLFLFVCLFVSFFPSKEVPLAFIIKLLWIHLTFTYLQSFWFLLWIWMIFFLGKIILVVGFSLSSLYLYPATPFWSAVSTEWSADNLMKIPCYLITFPWKKMKSLSCVWLCDPMNCSLPGSSVHEIFQARVLEWVDISFSRVSSQPGDWTRFSFIVGRRLYCLSHHFCSVFNLH